MINFTRAFDSAWERMMVILFRPFDPGKWFVIGFSAFLAGLLEGGNGINGGSFNNFNNLNRPAGNQNLNFDFNQFHANITHAISGWQVGIVLLIVGVALVFGFAIMLLVYWLGARGQFLFIDNIVRNRAGIAWPWSAYARQANSLFGFYILIVIVSLAVILPILGVAVVMCIPLFVHSRWPHGWEIGGLVTLGVLYLVVSVVAGFVIFVFREFGVPLMFRNGLMARDAFVVTLGLIKNHFASVFVFVLLRIALFLGVAVISVIACCFCCIGAIPYIGTVAILPALVFVRCFTLDCLAQFGPEYDPWTVDVPPPGPVLSPQPPLG